MGQFTLFGDEEEPRKRRRKSAKPESRAAKARRLRDEGMAEALDHADAVYPGWPELALAYVKIYAGRHRELTAEGVRVYAESCGLAIPPDKRSWGGVITRAARNGWLVSAGTTNAVDPKVHRSIITLWRSTLWQPS